MLLDRSDLFLNSSLSAHLTLPTSPHAQWLCHDIRLIDRVLALLITPTAGQSAETTANAARLLQDILFSARREPSGANTTAHYLLGQLLK